MSDATMNPTPPGILPAGIERKDDSVDTAHLNPVLSLFLRSLGLVHLHLFGKPCVLTSAQDGTHAIGSKHYKGYAVDLRMVDKTGIEQAAFLMILTVLARQMKLAVFDESTVPGAGHVHVEIAG